MPSGLKRTALFEEHLLLGARTGPSSGWEVPLEFEGEEVEVSAARESAGIFDCCDMTQLRIFGVAAKDSLADIFGSVIDGLDEVGQCAGSPFAGAGGEGPLASLILRSGDLEYMILVESAQAPSLEAQLAAAFPPEVEFANESERTGLVRIRGALASATLRELAGREWEPPPPMWLYAAALDSVMVLVACDSEAGDSFFLFCHVSNVVALWRLLLSFPEVTPCGLRAAEVLRSEGR